MSNVLVVYGTGTGCTEGIAERIGEALARAGADVEVMPAEGAPGPVGYDAVFVGSGVRAGGWHKPVRTWVAANSDALQATKVVFFTACLTMSAEPEKADEVRAYTDSLIAETGVEPVDIGLFAGLNEPAKFPFLERTILKMMKAPQGDFRDWDAVDAWATDMAGRLAL